MTESPYRSAPLQTRHRLVYEIGDEGVARLCESSAEITLAGESGAWAEDYLVRAGMSVARRAPLQNAPDAPDAPDEAAVLGALQAVEIIKGTLGLGRPGSVSRAMREAFPRE